MPEVIQINGHAALAGLVWRQLDTATTQTDMALHAEELAAKRYVTVGDPPACVGFVCDNTSQYNRMPSAAALVAASLAPTGTFIILEHYPALDRYWALVIMKGSVISDTDILLQGIDEACAALTSVVEFGVEDVTLVGNAIGQTELVNTLNLSEDRLVDALDTILSAPTVDAIKKAKIRKLPGKSHVTTLVLFILLGVVGWYGLSDPGIEPEAQAERAARQSQAIAAVNAAKLQDVTGPDTGAFMAAVWQLINSYDKHPVGWNFAGVKCEMSAANCYFNYISNTGLISELTQYFQLGPGAINIDISGQSVGFSQPLFRWSGGAV